MNEIKEIYRIAGELFATQNYGRSLAVSEAIKLYDEVRLQLTEDGQAFQKIYVVLYLESDFEAAFSTEEAAKAYIKNASHSTALTYQGYRLNSAK